MMTKNYVKIFFILALFGSETFVPLYAISSECAYCDSFHHSVLEMHVHVIWPLSKVLYFRLKVKVKETILLNMCANITDTVDLWLFYQTVSDTRQRDRDTMCQVCRKGNF